MPDLLPVMCEKRVGFLLLPKHKTLTVGRVNLLLGPRGDFAGPHVPTALGLVLGVQGTPVLLILLGMWPWDVPGSQGWGVSSNHQPLLQQLPAAAQAE